MCPRSLQGWVLLEELLGAGLHVHLVRCCHLPGGWRGLNRCPRPTSVTCEAAEGWERCGRLGCTGLDAGGWGAQGCLGILYAEVTSPWGVLPLGMRAGRLA